VTSALVVLHVGTKVGQAETVTLTSTSALYSQTSVEITPTVSTLTAHTPANVTTGTNVKKTAVNVSVRSSNSVSNTMSSWE